MQTKKKFYFSETEEEINNDLMKKRVRLPKKSYILSPSEISEDDVDETSKTNKKVKPNSQVKDESLEAKKLALIEKSKQVIIFKDLSWTISNGFWLSVPQEQKKKQFSLCFQIN